MRILYLLLPLLLPACMTINVTATPPSGSGAVEINCSINKELPITPSLKADGNTVTPKLVP